MFTQDDIRQHGYLVIASAAALPIFVSAIVIEGHAYVSGNSLTSSPLLTAIPESDEMHLIYMDPDLSQVPLGASTTSSTQWTGSLRLASRITSATTLRWLARSTPRSS